MNRRVAASTSLVAGLIAGCSNLVAGDAIPAPPGIVERALPSSADFARILGVPLQIESPAKVGGLETLRTDADESTPSDCAGVARAGQRHTYQGAPARSVALGLWTSAPTHDGNAIAAVSIVELDSQDSTRSWYARIAAAWNRCRGVTVTTPIRGITFIQQLTGTSDSDDTLTAEVLVSSSDLVVTPFRSYRALTARSHYLVDVEILGGPTTSRDARAIAHFVAGRFS